MFIYILWTSPYAATINFKYLCIIDGSFSITVALLIVGTGQLQIYEFKARSIEEITSKLDSHASGASCIRYVSTTKRGAGGWARVRVPIYGLQQHPRLTETRLQARATPRHLYTQYIIHNIYTRTRFDGIKIMFADSLRTHAHIYIFAYR